ncbi:MAG TPA: helix-hairpin-helix domain-containing protein, partial [Candidatus Nitrosotenuis sp.]|nr:helix-hairpin-helix domain-containing protein [Candidatus Nitrosotenuis sp.]
RFAVTFHRQRRGARQLRSELLDIPGVGEKTAQKLLRRFGSVQRIREVELSELSKVIPRAQAAKILVGLRGSEEDTR